MGEEGNMLNFFKNRFFRTAFLSYAITIGAIILAFYAIFLQQQKKDREEQLLQEGQAKAALMVQAVDEKFSAVELISTQIATGSWNNYVASNSDILYSRVDYFKRKEICQEIGVLNDTLRIARSTAVLFPQKNLAVDKASFWECERYFKKIGLDENMLEEVTQQLAGNYSTQVLFRKKGDSSTEGDFMIVKQLEYDDTPRELLFVLVDGKMFRKFVVTNMPDAAEFAILLDGETIYEIQPAETAEKWQEFVLPSRLYRWEYRFKIDLGYAGDYIWNSNFVILSSLGLLVVAALLSYVVARLTCRPISGLLEKLGRKKQDDLEEIEHIYESLKLEKEDMEELANQYYQIGQNGFLISLLLGTYDKERISELVKKFHTDFKADMAYMTIAFSNADTGKQEKFMDVMLKLQIDCCRNRLPAVLCNMEEMYVLILGALDGKTALLRQSEKISMLVDEYLSEQDVELYAGLPHIGFKGIRHSYQEANDKMLKSKNWGEQLAYYYPFDVEIRMVNQMRIGNFEEAQEILTELETENARRKVLPEIEKKVTDLVFEGFRRFATDMDLEWEAEQSAYRELSEAQDVAGLWQHLRSLLAQIADAYRESRQFLSLGSSLVKYVDENYTSSGLSQQDIADRFGVSRPTVSKMFKETVNMNFIDYLHRQRVEHAKRLFDQGIYEVLEVAKASGYENEVTFKRAFVKNEGMTPREYVKRKRLQM